MSQRRFDDLLDKLPRILEQGLRDLEFTSNMREAIQSRINSDAGEKTKRRPKCTLVRALRAAAAFLFLAGAISGMYWWNNRPSPLIPETGARPNFTEIETIDIDLDGEEPLELVNTWRVRDSDNYETLMALIWTRDSQGRLSVVSTHPFKGKDFLPLLTVSPAMYKGNLVIITSTDETERFYYCILGYDGFEVFEYLEMTTGYSEPGLHMLREIEHLRPASNTNHAN